MDEQKAERKENKIPFDKENRSTNEIYRKRGTDHQRTKVLPKNKIILPLKYK